MVRQSRSCIALRRGNLRSVYKRRDCSRIKNHARLKQTIDKTHRVGRMWDLSSRV
jgi:hypothetical protein